MMRLRCGNAPLSGGLRGGDFADHGSLPATSSASSDVLRRIHVQQTAAQHGQRASAGGQRAAMGRRVDAARQAADDRHARAGQAAGQPLGLRQAILRGMPRADDGDGQRVLRQDLAAHEEHAGRVVNFAQHARIGGVAIGQDRDAVGRAAGRARPATSISSLATAMRRVSSAPMPCTRRKSRRRGRQHGAGRAELFQQRLAQPRTDARDHRQPHGIGQRVVGVEPSSCESALRS